MRSFLLLTLALVSSLASARELVCRANSESGNAFVRASIKYDQTGANSYRVTAFDMRGKDDQGGNIVFKGESVRNFEEYAATIKAEGRILTVEATGPDGSRLRIVFDAGDSTGFIALKLLPVGALPQFVKAFQSKNGDVIDCHQP